MSSGRIAEKLSIDIMPGKVCICSCMVAMGMRIDHETHRPIRHALNRRERHGRYGGQSVVDQDDAVRSGQKS